MRELCPGRLSHGLLLLAVGLTGLSSAGVGARAQSAPDVITNATVIELTSAGVALETIRLIVCVAPSRFDTSAVALSNLRSRGVPDVLIDEVLLRARIDSEKAKGRPKSADIVVALERSEDGDVALVDIAPAPHTRAMSYGVFSAGMAVVVPGKRARVQAFEGRPTFRADLPGGRRPTDFVLSKFEESDEGGARQLDHESSLLFDVEQLADGSYQLRPREALRRGEYCFYLAGNPAAPGLPSALTIFDFSIVRR